MADLREAKAAAGTTPVLANTGVSLETVGDRSSRVADGAIVGTSLKVGRHDLERRRPAAGPARWSEKVAAARGAGDEPMAQRTRLYFATDLHGSEQCFRKFLNAGHRLRAPT